MAIDSTVTYLYITCPLSPAKIIRLTLSDFTTTSTLTLDTGENNVHRLVINTTHAYLACNDTPGKIVRVLLSDFSTKVTKTLAVNSAYSLILDSTYLYIGTVESPSNIIRLTLSDFTTVSTNTLTSNYAWALLIVNYELFVVTDSLIAKIDLNNFTTTALTTTITVPYYTIANIGSGILYAGGGGSPDGGISKINIYASPKFIETHKSKVWIFGFNGSIYRLYAYYSKTGDATDFTTANDAGYLVFSTVLSTFDTPTGLKSWGDYIVFFFLNNILIYSAGTDPNDFQLVKHIQNVGSLSNEVLQIGNDLWFPTRWGLRSLRNAISMGEIQYNNVSEDIDQFWVDNIVTASTNLDRMSIQYDKKREQIMILVNSSSAQSVCFYVYSIQEKAWSTYNINGLGASVDITCFMVTSEGLIYFGTSDGYIYELFSGTTDNGTAIDFIIRPVTQYFGSMDRHKKIKYVRLGIIASITAGQVKYDVDKKDLDVTVTGIAKTISGTLGLGYTELIPIHNRGKSWDFMFTDCGEIREITYLKLQTGIFFMNVLKKMKIIYLCLV